MPDGYSALTEKEKSTLRLIVRGHDAKSMARLLGRSVHTINERLRDARRKMRVSSSREAARLLFESEEAVREASADKGLGEAVDASSRQAGAAPTIGARRRHRLVPNRTGASIMSLAIALAAVATLTQLAPSRTGTDGPAGVQAASLAIEGETEGTARRWLALLDQGRWNDSYEATGEAFRKLNTSQVWAAASERVRAPLGAAMSRTLISTEELPAPPHGYQVVKFRTRFANKAYAMETVTLDREGGNWRVVGITVG